MPILSALGKIALRVGIPLALGIGAASYDPNRKAAALGASTFLVGAQLPGIKENVDEILAATKTAAVGRGEYTGVCQQEIRAGKEYNI